MCHPREVGESYIRDMKTNLTPLIQEARARTAETARAGDADKWKEYTSLQYPASMEWRLREGHEEFCRLQRLAFYGLI